MSYIKCISTTIVSSSTICIARLKCLNLSDLYSPQQVSQTAIFWILNELECLVCIKQNLIIFEGTA